MAQIIKGCTSFDRDDALERAQQVNEILAKAAYKYGFEFVNPFDLLCPTKSHTCIRFVEDKLIFRDDDHLNQRGATILAEEILQEAGWP